MWAYIEIPECYSTWYKDGQRFKLLNVDTKLEEDTLQLSYYSSSSEAKGRYTLVTLRRNVTPYRDSVHGTCDQVRYQKLVTRLRYRLVLCALGIWQSHQRDGTVTA